eukprot:m.188265 g.188265  ORF g.188265 m.188265 type:complete len:418 (+) comp18523_c0_seq1:284-1537(+)
MERTKEYKAIVKTCKVRLSKGDGALRKDRRKRKELKQGEEGFSARAAEVRKSITELRSYILQKAPEYVVIGKFLRQSSHAIGDSDRNAIDAEVKSFATVCQNAIHMLSAAQSAASETDTSDKHGVAVVDSLSAYLASVVKLHESTVAQYRQQSQDADVLSRTTLVDATTISGVRRRRVTADSRGADDGNDNCGSDDAASRMWSAGSDNGQPPSADASDSEESTSDNAHTDVADPEGDGDKTVPSATGGHTDEISNAPQRIGERPRPLPGKTSLRRRVSAAAGRSNDTAVCGTTTVDWARQALASGTSEDGSGSVDEGMRATIMQEMKLRSFAEDVLRAEAKVLEVSKLQSEFTQQLSAQSELVQTILHDTSTAQDNVGEGNKHIRKAMEDSNTLRNGVILFVLMCALCLFILEIASS